jgi:hypothetical protein
MENYQIKLFKVLRNKELCTSRNRLDFTGKMDRMLEFYELSISEIYEQITQIIIRPGETEKKENGGRVLGGTRHGVSQQHGVAIQKMRQEVYEITLSLGGAITLDLFDYGDACRLHR